MECVSTVVVMLSLSFPAGGSKPGSGKDVVASSIERLLDFSAEPSVKSLKALEHVYRKLPAATRQQPAVQYAYAVALIRQKRFREAGQILEALVEEEAADRAAWRAKIWIELELGERLRA